MAFRDLSQPKTANILNSLETCKNLIAEYRLEQKSCIGRKTANKKKIISCRIYHLLQRKKRIEAILARYPEKTPDPLHTKCQRSIEMKVKTSSTNDDKLKKFSLPSQKTVENTLSRVDEQIKIIEEDSKWCQSDLKIAHMIELLKFKDKVENILRIYPNGALILKKKVPTRAKKPPKEVEPFLEMLNKFNSDIYRIKEDPMWEMSEFKKHHVAQLLQVRQELEEVINENEKGKKYLEDLAKDPKIKLSCRLKFALKNVEDKRAEILDNKHWELDEISRIKMEKLRKKKQNLEDIIRHHKGEDFLKTRVENDSSTVKLPYNVMNHEVKDLEKIENQITELEKQEDTKFKKSYMDKLKRTKSSVETSIIVHKNGKEYLEQHAKKKELLKLEKELEAVDDELNKIDSSADGQGTSEEISAKKEALMKNKEEIQKKIEEIDGGSEYLEKRAKLNNEPVKLPDEAAQIVFELDELDKAITEFEKEPVSEEKTARLEELVKTKQAKESEIQQFPDGKKFLDERKVGPKRDVSKNSTTPKKYCAKLPRKVMLTNTLERINEQIASIEKDCTWCHSVYQSTRMAELLIYKVNVIQILKKFSMKDECQKKKKSPIELNDETKNLVEDLDKIEEELKELETRENSDGNENKKTELEKLKKDHETGIKEQDNGKEFLVRRQEKKNQKIDESSADENEPDTEATSKKPAIPKKIMVTLNSIENQMTKIADDDDHWNTNEYKKIRMKHLEKSKDNIENIIVKCQGGEELLAKKAVDEAQRVKLPKQANEHIRELDNIETKIDQANNWKDSDFRKKHIEKLQKSKVEIENEIKKVDKGEEYLTQRAELKAKQDRKSQQKKDKLQQAKLKKKNEMQKSKKATEQVNEDEELESTEFKAKYPKMVVILDTLDKVEKMIKIIELDAIWCCSEYKTARMIELLRTKDNIEHFIRKLPDGEEALVKKAEYQEAVAKRVPQKPFKKIQKMTLDRALAAAENLVSKFEDEIDSTPDVIKKTVLQKKLIKFKKLIDSAMEDSPEYHNRKENAEEDGKTKRKIQSTAEDKIKTPICQPRAENPPQRATLMSSLKRMQALTDKIEKDPTYKFNEDRLQYYQQMKQREDKIIETLNLLPKEDVSSFHYKGHFKLNEAQMKKNDLNKKCRCKKIEGVEREDGEEGNEGDETEEAPKKFFDPEYMNRLAKPRRVIVNHTLNNLGYQVNDDKRHRIECGLGSSQPMKPE